MKAVIRKARPDDIPKVAKIRMLWHKSEPLFLSKLRFSDFADIFTYLQKIEPKCFYIVERDDEILGYNIATSNTRRLILLLLFKHFFSLIFKFLISIKISNIKTKSGANIIQILEIFLYAISCTHAQASLSFFIVEEYRNLGLGSKILSILIDYFRMKEVKKVDIIVRLDNLDAQRFYEKYGFKKRRIMRYSPNLLIMTKELKS